MGNRDYLSMVVIGFRKDYYKHFKDDIHMYEYNANFKGNGFVTTPMI